MWLTEVILRARWPEEGETLEIGSTAAPAIVRSVADALLRDAEDQADRFDGDETLRALAEAEAERLRKIVDALMPGPEGHLRAVPR